MARAPKERHGQDPGVAPVPRGDEPTPSVQPGTRLRKFAWFSPPGRPGPRRPPSTPTLLRGYLLIGSLILTSFALFYTNRVVTRLNEQTSMLSLVMARLLAVSTSQVAARPDSVLQEAYREVTRPINFPLIITDAEGMPRAWKNVPGLEMSDVSEEELESADLSRPTPAIALLRKKAAEYDRLHEPEPLQPPGQDEIIGYFHYGPSPIVGEIRWVPWVLFLAAALFAVIGIIWFRSLRRSEQNLIWAGMAKETAHQLGTPISSLMGWMELVHSEARPAADGTTKLPTPLYQELEKEVLQDLERLKKVASRFSHIGSLPSLSLQDIVPIVASTVDYYRRRLPRQGIKVVLEEHFEADVPPINVNAELMGWVVENLVKNAIDATDTRTGRIEISVNRRPQSETVEISVRDNGRGIAPADQKRVFDPGFTTRQRGWGLGLTLARRIVEEYHGGRLELRQSIPGKGSEFVVIFPV